MVSIKFHRSNGVNKKKKKKKKRKEKKERRGRRNEDKKKERRITYQKEKRERKKSVWNLINFCLIGHINRLETLTASGTLYA
jgi:hypothetical protein